MSIELKVPALGESVTEAVIAQWFKKVGDSVALDEPLVELETDKINVEINATSAGVLSEILAKDGDTVAVGDVVGRIDESAGAQPAATSQASPAEAKPETRSEAAPAGDRSPNADVLAPSVRRLVEENQLSPAEISASGKDGRLTKGDVLAHLETQRSAPAPAAQAAPKAAPKAAPAQPLPAMPSSGSHKRVERVRMSPLRKTIAKRLVQAQHEAAMLTTFNEVDMSAIMGLRSTYQDRFVKKYGHKIGFMSFFVKAVIEGLKDWPGLNAEIDGDSVIYKYHYDIGVAVGGGKGLVVPVIRDADRLSFSQVELSLAELAKRARDNKLGLEDLTGGTFTVSNGGIYGSMMSTPILNAPQTGILGMHNIVERPMAINGKVEIRPMMYLALSYDHRVVDGREAVSFLVKVKECLEAPERILLEV